MHSRSEYQQPVFLMYMAEIGRYTIPTREEEVEYAQKIKSGDLEARNELWERNLKLVVKIAGNYCNRGVPLMDLISEGNLGLLRAVQKFDSERGFKFSTYASFWINQFCKRALMNLSRDVRVPVYVYGKRYQLKKIRDEFREKCGTDPTDEELADATGVSLDKIKQYLHQVSTSRGSNIELGAPRLLEDSEVTTHESFEDVKVVSPCAYTMSSEEFPILVAELQLLLEAVYASEENPRKREIFMAFYGIDRLGITLTLREVGEFFGVTRERVRQIKNQVWEKMARNFPNLKSGEDYFIALIGRITEVEALTGQTVDFSKLVESAASASKKTAVPQTRIHCKTVPMLRRFLRGEIRLEIGKDALDTIIKAVSAAYGIDDSELVGTSTERPILWPRKVMIHFALLEGVPETEIRSRLEKVNYLDVTEKAIKDVSVAIQKQPEVAESLHFLHDSIKALLGSC